MRQSIIPLFFTMLLLSACATVISLYPANDIDGDGILNADDRCMETRGPRQTRGCEDANKNNIADIDEPSAMTRVSSLTELREQLRNNSDNVLVILSSRWCGPCIFVKEFWKEHGNTGLPVHVVLWHDETEEHWTFTEEFQRAYTMLTRNTEMELPSCVLVPKSIRYPGASGKTPTHVASGIEECTTQVLGRIQQH